jgi:hypothetical protein
MDVLPFASASGIGNLPGGLFHGTGKIFMNSMTLFKMKIDFIVLK